MNTDKKVKMVIEKYSGRWIVVIADKGITSSGMSPKFIRLIMADTEQM